MTEAMEVAENPRAVHGDNRPPFSEIYAELNTDLQTHLETDFASVSERTDELLKDFDKIPVVLDADSSKKVTDIVAQIAAHVKDAEAKRVALTTPVLKAQRQINTFFDNGCFDALDVPDKKRKPGAKQLLLARLTTYENEQAAIEKRRREEEERKAAAAAAEAERIARIEQERVERERAAAHAAEVERMAKINSERDLQKALELEEENKRLNAEREAVAKIAADAAEAARAEAEKAAAATKAKAAEMTTVRGDYGSSSSLRTTWKARFKTDAEAVDLNALRGFIGNDVIEKAANAHARTHKATKPVTGLVFYEETQAVVRG